MILDTTVTNPRTIKLFATLEERFYEVHANKYTYKKAVYTKAITPIVITCPIHGDFTQSPSSHLKGHECNECGIIKRSITQRKTRESFIEEASKHYQQDFYTYDKVEMGTSNKDKVIVTCAKHGDFNVIINNHVRGKARCMKCSLRDTTNKKIWAYSDWEKAGLKSSKFDSFKLYIIRCFNDNETFLKIGKTYTTIANRFRHPCFLPYDYEVIKTYEGSARFISELETTYHALCKNYLYSPKQAFGGQHECFLLDAISILP